MQIVGFNFTKISAFRSPDFRRGSLNTNMVFLDITEEKLPLLSTKAQKVTFRFSIEYKSPEAKKEEKPEPAKEPKEEKKNLEAEIAFEGEIVLSVSEKETEKIQKAWEKKELPPEFNVFLFNMILKRCSLKALQIEDELNLPNHIPFPSLKTEPKKKD